MRALKILLGILSLSYLSSCSAPTIEDQEQCSPYFAYVEILGEQYIDTKESVCFCRQYRFSREYVGPIGTTYDMPIEHCDKLIGHPPDAYGEVSAYYEKLRRYLDRMADKKEKQ